SDLEIRTPGYLMLRPAWQRKQLATGVTGAIVQSVAWNNDIWTTFGGNVYFNSAGTSFNPGMTVKFIDTDGNALIFCDGVNTFKLTTDNSTFTVITSAATAAPAQFWAVNQGTNGRFLYYSNPSAAINNSANVLYKIDLTAFGPGVLVSTGLNFLAIKDVCEH